ncbi:MAG: hypothetical protein GHCLOJNM_03638 [bacterium]|nr:hypothetical protein [bacterium]
MKERHFLYCWSLDTADWEQDLGTVLNHIAGQQLKRVAAGDTVWIVTHRDGAVSLRGRIVVDAVTDFDGACERLGTTDLWESDYHLIAEPGTEEPLDDIPLEENVALLRFNSKKDRFTVEKDGRVDYHQMQTMRELTPESAELLQKIWDEAAMPSGSEIPLDQAEEWSRGAGFGEPEKNRRVEEAAVKFVTEWYTREGWAVVSVESEKLGYDLVCKKEGMEESVEVKGVSGEDPRFIITEREVNAAETLPDFFLCVVTAALTSRPQLHRFSGEEFLDKYNLFPIQHLAVPRKAEGAQS